MSGKEFLGGFVKKGFLFILLSEPGFAGLQDYQDKRKISSNLSNSFLFIE